MSLSKQRVNSVTRRKHFFHKGKIHKENKMTFIMKIGPKETTNQETDENKKPSFVKTIQDGPYSDTSARNWGHVSEQFFITWIKRSCMRKHFLKDNTDEFIKKDPEGQYLVSVAFLRDLKTSTEIRLKPQEMEFSLWILEWIEKFKGQTVIIETT